MKINILESTKEFIIFKNGIIFIYQNKNVWKFGKIKKKWPS